MNLCCNYSLIIEHGKSYFDSLGKYFKMSRQPSCISIKPILEFYSFFNHQVSVETCILCFILVVISGGILNPYWCCLSHLSCCLLTAVAFCTAQPIGAISHYWIHVCTPSTRPLALVPEVYRCIAPSQPSLSTDHPDLYLKNTTPPETCCRAARCEGETPTLRHPSLAHRGCV